jgi:hypothetical protein
METTLVETSMNPVKENTAKSVRTAMPARRRQSTRLPQHFSVALDCADSAGRGQLEACIARRFDQKYGARIQHFLPYLLSLHERARLDAVVGIRLAAESELFLERYLDERVEQAISRTVRTPVDRDQVVEIGNLASAIPGTASLLFGVLAITLDRAGVHWVACTATPQVQAMLDELNFPAYTLCEARAALLGDQADQWGDYYASRPKVIFGDTRIAAAAARANPAMDMLIGRLAGPIRQVAEALRATRQR